MTNTPNTQPIFIRNPTIHSIVLSNELGSTSPTSTLIPKTFIVAADPATAIETIEVQPTGMMVRTVMYLYLFNTTGTQGQSRLIFQQDLPEITFVGPTDPIAVRLPKTLSPSSQNPLQPNQMLRLPQGWELRAALSVAIDSPIIVTAFGGSY